MFFTRIHTHTRLLKYSFTLFEAIDALGSGFAVGVGSEMNELRAIRGLTFLRLCNNESGKVDR